MWSVATPRVSIALGRNSTRGLADWLSVGDVPTSPHGCRRLGRGVPALWLG